MMSVCEDDHVALQESQRRGRGLGVRPDLVVDDYDGGIGDFESHGIASQGKSLVSGA
jgi:hypothetical protein